MDAPDDTDPPEVIELPLDGVLDLHAFAPRDAADVVATWLDASREAGLVEVRIVHGKGVGVLRRIVEGVLRRHPAVASFRSAQGFEGGWGATTVTLRPGREGTTG